MKFKFDENLDARLGLKLTGHDVASVTSQKPGGRPDEVIAKVCASEGRILVTLDLDFSNPLRFPPGNMCDIIILRPKRTLFPRSKSWLMNSQSGLPHAIRKENFG